MHSDWKKDPVIRIAQLKFNMGDRVKLSDAGHRQFHWTPIDSSKGEVVGFGRNPQIIRIILDGQKTPAAFHMEFWQKDDLK